MPYGDTPWIRKGQFITDDGNALSLAHEPGSPGCKRLLASVTSLTTASIA